MKKTNSIPSLDSILEDADAAYTGMVRNYYALGSALTRAETFYGDEGKRAFRIRFPLTDNAIRNLELVGRGRLLPEFAMCSDRFVKGLVGMDDSLEWQHRLIGASEGGMIRVRRGSAVCDMKFTDFVAGRDVDGVIGVLSMVAAGDENLTSAQLADRIMEEFSEARSRFRKSRREDFRLGDSDGVKVVRFYRSRAWTVAELREIIGKMEES